MPQANRDPQCPLRGSDMATKIFVNLPVKSLPKSVDFFSKLGFRFDPKFTDETATCMIVAEGIYVMLLTVDKFKTFTRKKVCNATKSIEMLLCLTCESRGKVDEMVYKAITAGGTTYSDPQDYGFMYGHGFQDLDGHVWELIYMQPSAITKAENAAKGKHRGGGAAKNNFKGKKKVSS